MKTIIIYLTDKNGGKMFKNYIGESFLESAKRDLQRHIDSAKINPKLYSFLDVESAEIKIETLKQ